MEDTKSKYSWNNLTIGQYIEITNILEMKSESDINKLVGILCVLNNNMPEHYKDNISIDELKQELFDVAEFLSSDDVDCSFKHIDTYELLGKKFVLTYPAENICAGQFIDYENSLHTDRNNIAMQMAILLHPKGGRYMEYKDGSKYDLQQLANEVYLKVPMTKARGVANFFWQASLASKITSLQYSKKMLQRAKRKEKDAKKKEIIQIAIERDTEVIKTLKKATLDLI